MIHAELQQKLDELIAGWENECVEFKEANDNFPTSDIGKYFSALANEANLKNTESGWLVFGVRNRTRSVVGTTYREDRERLHSIKKQIADGTDPGTTFKEVHVLGTTTGMRVILFEVPPAPRGIPIGWNGHFHARDHESLAGLSIAKLDEIRSQSTGFDWSAVVVPEATLNDLDPEAIAKARSIFQNRFAKRLSPEVVQDWSNAEFLEQARLTSKGRITRATLLLLGKHTTTHYIGPAVAELSWKLEGPERAYEHFGPPFLLTTSLLFGRIRNILLKFYPVGELLPQEMLKYDEPIVLEALHNCIAHQDYTRNERVLVIERIGELEFQNAGGFFDGTPEDYLLRNKTPSRYRNRFLAEAMMHLGMVDRMGFGIREVMYRGQASKFRPLPFYEKEGPDHVVLKLPGRIIDENYSRALLANPDLQLPDIMALDRVQKGMPLPDEAATALRKRKLIEGRKPKYHVSAAIASATGQKAVYIRNRGFDDAYYRDLVLGFLKEFGHATKQDLRDLLCAKFPDVLNDVQKEKKISTLTSSMKRQGSIRNTGSRSVSKWVLTSR